MVPVAVVACAAWLFLFVMVLIVPPPPGPHRGGGLGGGRGQQAGNGDAAAAGTEAPAVVSLLAGRLGKLGFGATLADLAARGWFQVRGPGGGSGPAMCVVAAQPPGGALAPFERRVVAHVALRAGASGQVPASALADGFEGGEDQFMKAFKEEVDADAPPARPYPAPADRAADRPAVRAAGRPRGGAGGGRRGRAPALRAGLGGRPVAGRLLARRRGRYQPAPHRGRAGGAETVAVGRGRGAR